MRYKKLWLKRYIEQNIYPQEVGNYSTSKSGRGDMKKSKLDQTFATKIIYSKELLIDRLTIYKFLNYIFWQADPSGFAQEIKVKENNFLVTHSRVNNLNYVPRCMPTLHPYTPNTLLIYVIRNKKVWSQSVPE